MFATAFHSPSFSYAASPAHAELETLVCDWAAAALGLPPQFTFAGAGGGTIAGSISEAALSAVHMAKYPFVRQGADCRKLVAYHSSFSHSSITKAFKLKDIYLIRTISSSLNK
jgi:aromatic-L-amino-acid decarboxylase